MFSLGERHRRPTDAAGGFVDGGTKERLARQGVRIFGFKNNDAYHALAACGGLPTGGDGHQCQRRGGAPHPPLSGSFPPPPRPSHRSRGRALYRQGVIGHGRQTDDLYSHHRPGGWYQQGRGQLFITQSALDQQLLKLEHELGTRLFPLPQHLPSLRPAGST